MERDELVEAAPLLTGTLRDRRQEVKRNLVKFILSLDKIDTEFATYEIVELADSEMGINLDRASVTEALDYLGDEGLVEHISGEDFRIVVRPEVETFNTLIEPVWEEFSAELRKRDKDVDVEFLDDEIETAFKTFLYKFFELVLESSEEISEYEIDTLETINFESVIEDLAAEHRVERDKLFKNTLKEYIDDPGENLKEFTQRVYTGIINYDILHREEETIQFELQVENKQLFLDTNVLVALLCESDNFHPIITSALDRANQLGYDIYYLPQTADELETFIEGSKRELDEFRSSGGGRGVIDSQFVRDYLQRDISYSNYVASIFSNWRDRLESNGIVEYTEEFDVDEGLYEIAEDTIKKIERVKDQHGSSIKAPHKIEHDAKLLSLVAEAKETAENPNVGPFVVSFDRTVTTVGNLRETGSGEEVSLHPRNLLEYILAFSPVEIAESDRGDVAIALLRSATNFEETVDIQEYAKLIRPRLGLEEGQEELLARILTESDKYTELEEALENNRGDEADEIAVEILSDDSFLRELSDEWRLREKMREASQTVEEKEKERDKYKRKYENEKEMRESLQQLLQQSEGQNVFIQNAPEANAEAVSESVSEADANAKAQAIQEFEAEVNNFIEALDLRLENGIEQSEIPNPPEDTSDVNRTREWLDTVTAALASDAVIKGGKALLPWAQELLDKASELGGL